MGTLNDEILRATGGPTVQDGLQAFFLLNGATQGPVEDMEREYLLGAITLTPPAKSTNQDLWLILLEETILGKGTLNDKLLIFWTAK